MQARELQRLQTLARQGTNSASKSLFSRALPKRLFNDKIDRQIERFLERIPEGNIGFLLVGLNTLIYGLYLMWPTYNMYSFLNHFTFSPMSLKNGYLHSMLLCHFTNMGFINYAIQSVIVFMLCRNLSMMYGGLYITKTVLLSMALGTGLVFLQQNLSNYLVRPYCGNDAFLRGLIFSVIF